MLFLWAVALLRIFAHDRLFLTTLLDAYTWYIYLPTYAVVFGALVLRRWRTAVAAAGLVALHLYWVAPDYAGPDAIPAAAYEAPRITVYAANIQFNNEMPGAAIDQALASGADVIVLVEFTPVAERLMAERQGGRYSHFIGSADTRSIGVALYSRHPIQDARVLEVQTVPIAAIATVQSPGGDVRIYGIHPSSPTDPHQKGQWDKQYRALLGEVDGETLPTLIAGDFNATQHNRWYDRLADLGFRDAHQVLGEGRATTWPTRTIRWQPIRIDQVMTRGGLVPLSIDRGRAAGSDHLPTLSEFAIWSER